MKKLIVLLAFTTLYLGATAQGSFTLWGDDKPALDIRKEGTQIEWLVEEHDLKEIKQGVPVSVVFTLKNVSGKELIIKNVKTACGCTVAEYEKAPIPSGSETRIKAEYNAKSLGNFSKSITVTTNLEEMPKTLLIKGAVIKDTAASK